MKTHLAKCTGIALSSMLSLGALSGWCQGLGSGELARAEQVELDRLEGISESAVRLEWKASTEKSLGFRILRRSAEDVEMEVVAKLSPATRQYVDDGLESNVEYVYAVIAYDLRGRATRRLGSVRTRLDPAFAPLPPRGIVVEPPRGAAVEISWADTSDEEQGFSIERAEVDLSGVEGPFHEIARLSAGVTRLVDATVELERSYHYRVRAFNSAGSSEYSAEAYASTFGLGALDRHQHSKARKASDKLRLSQELGFGEVKALRFQRDIVDARRSEPRFRLIAMMWASEGDEAGRSESAVLLGAPGFELEGDASMGKLRQAILTIYPGLPPIEDDTRHRARGREVSAGDENPGLRQRELEASTSIGHAQKASLDRDAKQLPPPIVDETWLEEHGLEEAPREIGIRDAEAKTGRSSKSGNENEGSAERGLLKKRGPHQKLDRAEPKSIDPGSDQGDADGGQLEKGSHDRKKENVESTGANRGTSRPTKVKPLIRIGDGQGDVGRN